MKYFAKLSFGYTCMETYEIIEADSMEEAESTARTSTFDWAEQFGFYSDAEFFATEDEVGRVSEDWICGETDEEEKYEEVGEVAPEVCEYVPELHDDLM